MPLGISELTIIKEKIPRNIAVHHARNDDHRGSYAMYLIIIN